jgi:hypothetical protein
VDFPLPAVVIRASKADPTGVDEATTKRAPRPGRHALARAPQAFARAAAALAGPALIAGGVIAILHRVVAPGDLGNYSDLWSLWMPTYCALGRSLAAGHVPLWDPHVMGGLPFAADPQSGWMYLPVMALFTSLPCGVAFRSFVVLQPILGGLGLYWFLRAERVSRPAATTGGLVLALVVAKSATVLALPFAASLAWTAVLLAAAARLLRVSTWPSRLAWIVLTALVWGQLAAALLTYGVALGTGALVAYGLSRLVGDVRAGRRKSSQAVAMALLLAAGLPLFNLAYLAPRLAYLPHTSLGQGYAALRVQTLRLSGGRWSGKTIDPPMRARWPLDLAISPGPAVGGAALALSFAGWFVRPRRGMTAAFTAFGILAYLLTLRPVSSALGTLLRSRLGDLFRHDPSKFGFGVLLALAVLAGLGLQAWLEAPSARTRALMVAPAALVWGVVPPIMGARSPVPLLPVLGALAGAAALVLSARARAFAAAVPLLLCAELVTNGFVNQQTAVARWRDPLHRPGDLELLAPVRGLDFNVAQYLHPRSVARALQERSDHERYLSLDRADYAITGYHAHYKPGFWGLMATQRSLLFGLEEAQGYNSVQEPRYWTFARAVDVKPMKYNAADFVDPKPVLFDLLRVGWVVKRWTEPPPARGASPVARGGSWVLYRLPHVPPQASVVTRWTVVASPSAALADVVRPGFDAARVAVLERPPPLRPSSGGTGVATYVPLGEDMAQVKVRSSTPAIVVLRNTFDPGWQATVDGRPAPVLATDCLVQGVPVPAGRHTITLVYQDPSVWRGLAGTAAALVAALATVTALELFRRRRSGDSEGTRPEDGRELDQRSM